MDQIIGNIHSIHCGWKVLWIEDIALNHLHFLHPGSPSKAQGIPGKNPHMISAFQQAGDQAAAYIAGGAGYQNFLGV
jgi:hypothetical protein